MQDNYSVESSASEAHIAVIQTREEKLRAKRYRLFAEAPLYKTYFFQCSPNIIGSFYQLTANAIMVMVLSHYNSSLTSAMSFSHPMVDLIRAMAMLFGSGTNNTVAFHFGRKDYKKAEQSMFNGLVLCFLIYIVILVIFYPLTPAIVTSFGTPEHIRHYTTTNSRIFIACGIIYNLSRWSNGVLRAQGSPKIVLFSLVISSTVSAVLAYVCCTKLNWGITGYSFASVANPLVNFLFNIPFLFFGKWLVIKPKITRINRLMWDVVKMGCSESLSMIAGMTLSATMNKGIAKITHGIQSPDPKISLTTLISSAHGATASITDIIFNTANTLATNATLPLANFCRGARLWRRFRKVNITGFCVTFVFVFAFFSLIWALNYWIPNMYFTDELHRATMRHFLRIYMPGRIICSPAITIIALFQAVELNFWATVISFLRKIFVISVLNVILMFTTTDVWVFLLAFPIGDAISTFLSFIIMAIWRNTLLLTRSSVEKKIIETEVVTDIEDIKIDTNIFPTNKR